jgi:hypothetical protein
MTRSRKANGEPAPPADPPDDPVEIWGRRVGRGLSLVALAGLALLLIWQIAPR